MTPFEAFVTSAPFKMWWAIGLAVLSVIFILRYGICDPDGGI